MWKFSGFKIANNQVRLYLANEVSNNKTRIDCDLSLADYNLGELIGKEYKPVNSVSELVKTYKLKKRESVPFVRISSFKLGA